MAILSKYCNLVTSVNDKITKYFSIWLIYPMIFALCYDCIGRYIFSNVSLWSYDLTWILFGSLFYLGGGYVLGLDGHVRADVIYVHLPKRAQCIIMMICFIVLFFPEVIGLVYVCGKATIRAYVMGQTTATTLISFPMWIMRGTMTFGLILLFFQGTERFIYYLMGLIDGNQKEEVE